VCGAMVKTVSLRGPVQCVWSLGRDSILERSGMCVMLWSRLYPGEVQSSVCGPWVETLFLTGSMCLVTGCLVRTVFSSEVPSVWSRDVISYEYNVIFDSNCLVP
jgi:hypothetical protein